MRLLTKISNRLMAPRRAESGLPIRAVNTGKASPLLLPVPLPSRSLMNAGDRALEAAARRTQDPLAVRESGRLDSLILLARWPLSVNQGRQETNFLLLRRISRNI